MTRCCAAEIKTALLALLAGEAFLADRPWSELWWGQMHLDLASGWQLGIEIDRDQLGALRWAQAPDGRDWLYGCQRDDWTLGPDSRVVEPVALLQPEQRQKLERLLRDAMCWPPPLGPSDWVVPMGNGSPSHHYRRSACHRAATRAGQDASGQRSRTGSPLPHFESGTDRSPIQIRNKMP